MSSPLRAMLQKTDAELAALLAPYVLAAALGTAAYADAGNFAAINSSNQPFVDSFAVSSLNTETREAFDENGNLIAAWGVGSTYGFAVYNGFATDNIFSVSGVTDFGSNGDNPIKVQNILDGSNIPSVKPYDRTLNNSSSNVVFDFEYSTIYDAGTPVAYWSGFGGYLVTPTGLAADTILTSSGNPSIDVLNRQFTASDGSTLIFNYNAAGTADFFSNNVTTLGSFVAGLGSAGSPSYTFSGDLDTGIFSPTADSVAICTGGAEWWRVNSVGGLISATNILNIGFSNTIADANSIAHGNSNIVTKSGFASGRGNNVTPSNVNQTDGNIAIGTNNISSGGNYSTFFYAKSVVTGDNNNVSGLWSLAYGNYNIVTNASPTAFSGTLVYGNNNTLASSAMLFGSNGNLSTGALGLGDSIYASNGAIVIGKTGNNGAVSGLNAIKIGNETSDVAQTANYSISIGSKAQTFGIEGVTIGRFTSAGGLRSVAMGNSISAYHDNSICIGNNTLGLNITSAGVSVNNQNPLSGFHATGTMLVTDVTNLGAELVTNGTFPTGIASWTAPAGWRYGANNVYHDTNGTGAFSQVFATTIGKHYYCTFTMEQYQSGTITVQVAGVTLPVLNPDNAQFGAARTYRAVVKATSATQGISFTPSNTARLLGLDNISVKEILGGSIRALGALRLGLEDTNYIELSTGATGTALFTAAGAGAAFNFTHTIRPNANDGAALGTSALMWSDLFLASGAVVNFNNGDVTLTHATDKLTLAGGDLEITARNIITDTTTGMKIGSATAQKLGLWNATPIVQPTTAGAAAIFVTNTSLIANDSGTFDGYTIGQVVKALRNIGILA